MTLPAPELQAMQQDMSGLIDDWGKTCAIKRKATTRNSAGQVSGSFTTLSNETLWIQPIETGRATVGGRGDPGILDRMTHECFQNINGYIMQTDDRILEAGDVYEYDVLSVATLSTHKHIYLQKVKRS